MRFEAVIVVAALCSFSLANYDINLYKSANCKGKIGETCRGVAAGACCSRASGKGSQQFSQFSSANFREVGGGQSTDNLKMYSAMGGSACGLPTSQGTGCVSPNGKTNTGAAVFVVVEPGSAHSRRSLQPRHIEPDTFFYEDGATRHTIPIRSLEGEAFEMLESEEDQINFLKARGEKSPMN